MDIHETVFSDERVMLVFTTSPAGLGHVRVTEALRKGLPENVRSELVGVRDPSIKFLHRVTSRNRFLRRFTESVQNHPFLEEGFTDRYRKYLVSHAGEAYEKLRTLIKRQRPHPKSVVIVSTHFSLAHQIASIKDRLAEELGTCVALVVVVTDDSPQHIWGVFGADYIFVPSDTTKELLERYMLTISGRIPEMVVIPYPISKVFSRRLDEEGYRQRLYQLQPKSDSKMQIMVPISGAAVQLSYLQELIGVLGYGGFSDISVVTRDSSFTKGFISWCQQHPSVRVMADTLDRDVVMEYERQYEKEVFSLEITKPSEQTFKVLVTPKRRGGVIMLFSDPVGRQEDDNVAFMMRHRLLPSPEDQRLLFNPNATHQRLKSMGVLERARFWRGLLLPIDGARAGSFVVRMRGLGVLEAMGNFSGYIDHPELRGSGVKQFWETLSVKVKEKCAL